MKKSLLSFVIPSRLHKITLLAFFLLTLGVGQILGATYVLTPNQTTTGSNATTYITTLTEFTHAGISWKMNQWNPSTLQIKTNQSSATSEFRFYNTSAFPGKITQVVIKFSALTVSDASKLMFLGGTSEVTGTTGGTAGTWNSTSKTLTWTPGASDKFTYFAFYQNGKAASGTNNLDSDSAIVVTYSAPPCTITLMDDNSTLTEASSGAGVTLPTRTGCTGYTFAGWTKSWTEEQDEWTTTAPTIIPAGNYSPTANENLYPVYTKTESGGGTSDDYKLYSGTLTEGDYIIYYDGKAMNTTVTSDRLQYEEVTPSEDVITTTDASIIWHIAPSGDYWTIYNADEETYAASIGAKNKAQMLEDGTDDKSLWTVSGTETYEFVNKQNTTNSVNANLRNNGTYGFACYATSTGGALSLYKNVTGGSTTSYISVPDCAPETCDNAYTFAYGATANSDGKNIDDATLLCFSQVGSTSEYQITGFTIPTTTQYYWVGYNNSFYNDNLGTGSTKSKSSRNQFKYLPVANLQGSSCSASGDNFYHAMAGAYGTLRIYANYSDNNLYVGFVPAGYFMRVGSGDSWSNIQLTQEGSSAVWKSEVMDMSAELIAKKYYVNVYSGASYSSSDAGVSINSWTNGDNAISTVRHKTNSGDNWANNVTASMRGFFRIWTDNCAANGYTHFIPTHRVVFKANWPEGASGAEPGDTYSTDVSVEESMSNISLADAPTAPAGYTFDGWYDAATGGTKVTTARTISAGATSDITLYAHWSAVNDYVLVESGSQITEGDYLIVYNNTYALNTHSGNVNTNTYGTYSDISSFYSNKQITSNSITDALAFVVQKTTNGYSFYKESEGTYLGYNSSSSSTGAYLRWDKTFTDNQNEWTLDVNSIVSAYYASNAIRWNNNSGSYRFAIYAVNGQQEVQLFKKNSVGPIIRTTGTLSKFSYIKDEGPSVPQTFNVSGRDLTGNLTVTAPSNYQVSLDGNDWASSKTISASGLLSTTVVYVRLSAGLSVGDYNGNITISGGGAESVTVGVEGSVTCPIPTLTFTSTLITKYSDSPKFTNPLTITNNSGNGTITYTSSDETKATVNSSGEVTIVGATADGSPVEITASMEAVSGVNCQSAASASYYLVIAHKVTWYVNGSEYYEGNPTIAVADGGSIDNMPTPPDGSAICGDKEFVGWTAIANYSNASTAPNDLFLASGEAPKINGDKNFYAVFANVSGTANSYVRIKDAKDWKSGQKIIIVANNNNKMLASDFTGGDAPTESGGKITVSDSKYVWTIGSNDGRFGASWYQIYSGDVVLSAADGVTSSNKYQYIEALTDENEYYSWWALDDELTTPNCFALYNDVGGDSDDDGYSDWISYLEWYNSGSKWESYYVTDFSTETHFALRLYKSDATYTNYSVTCTTPWVVTATSGGHGTVTAEPIYVTNGGSATLTLTPNDGYECSSVTLNSGTATEGTLNNCSYTLTNIQSNVELVATFTKAPVYHVVLDAGDGKVVGYNANTTTLTETTRTMGVLLPAASSCSEDWTFAYWSTANPEDESNTVAPVHTADPGQKFVPDEDNITLYAIYTKSTGTASYTYKTDELTYDKIGVSGTTYKSWTNKYDKTAARYAGTTAGGKESIQLRSKGSESGIVTTVSGGSVSQVTITWNEETTENREVNIYGYNSPYESPSELYGNSIKGVLLGTLTYDGTIQTNTLDIKGTYSYIGIRSKSDALYLNKISIKWITAVTGLTTYYCHKPTCDDCIEPTYSFAKSLVTLSYPHADPYINNFTSNNTSPKTYSSSNTSVATIDANTGEVTIRGIGSTIITVKQKMMTSGSTKYCAVEDSYTLNINEASVDVVEVTNDNKIIIEHDMGTNTEILIDQLMLHEEGKKADEVFFSKYFEATGSVKLVALYNGTGKTHDPSKYRIRCVSTSTASHTIKVGDYVEDWPSGKELIFYSWDENNSSDLSVLSCATQKADNGEIRMEDWIAIPWSSYTATKPAVIFGGSDAVVLEEYDGTNWNILDIIGAVTSDGKKADATNLVGKSVITWGDGSNKGWYCSDGESIEEGHSTLALSTLRCLLIRKYDVLSGVNARNTSTGNFGTGNFNTLCTEWYGKHVDNDNPIESTCDAFSEVGNFNYYNAYQKYEELSTTAFSAEDNNADGTVTITINPEEVPGGLAGLSCNYLKIKVTNSDKTEVLAEVEYKVPIIVSANGTKTDNTIFTKFDDCSICDVAVLGNATLESTADGKNSVHDVEVYPGAKLTVPSTQTLDVNQLILRSKGDDVPLANIQGTLNRTKSDILFDKRIDGLRWYFFTLPYDCAVSDIMFRDGATAEHGVDFLIQYYDGEERAREATSYVSNSKHWKQFTGTTLKAGVGYIVAVEPKTGHTYSELRFPMKNANLSTSSVSVPVHAWGGDKADEELNPSHKGWNLIGNPFLNTYNKDKVDGPIKVGLIEYSQTEGDWVLTGNVRYLYKPYEGGASYYEPISVATEELPPFTGYFVQIGGDNPSDELNVSFAKSSVKASMPHRLIMAEVDDSPVWLAFDITNSRGESDEATLLVSDQFTDGYDMMNDLVKWRGSNFGSYTRPLLASRNNMGEMAFNALPDATAKTGVALNYFAAERGQYTLSLSRKYSLDNIDEVWLYDSVEQIWHDLLLSDYSFSSARTDDKSRFTLTVRVRRQPKITTDISDISGLSDLRIVTGDRRLSVLSVPAGADLWIFDSSGKLIDERLSVSADRLLFDVPASGVYNVRVVTADSAVTLKAVVK